MFDKSGRDKFASERTNKREKRPAISDPSIGKIPVRIEITYMSVRLSSTGAPERGRSCDNNATPSLSGRAVSHDQKRPKEIKMFLDGERPGYAEGSGRMGQEGKQEILDK